MIKVLIADDERTIREGLAFGIDWAELNMNVIGLAGDGREAYNKIIETEPDLVIIDIRMPELSGIEVIKKVREQLGSSVTFIILSGYSEFEYAQQGISYGVVEYLLKPTDDLKLTETLTRVGSDIEKEKKRNEFEDEMRRQMEEQMPIIREHLLKDYITNSYFEAEDFEYYKKYFDLSARVRMVIYHISKESSVEEMFSLKSMILKTLGESVMCFTVRSALLVIIPEKDSEGLSLRLRSINQYFHEYYDSDLQVLYTDVYDIKTLPYVYSQSVKCSAYSFYLTSEYIVSMEEILSRIDTSYDAHFINYSEIVDAINAGNVSLTEGLLKTYFERLTEACFDVSVTKTYLTELHMAIMRCSDALDSTEYVKRTLEFSQAESIEDIKRLITSVALSIAESKYDAIADNCSKSIETAIRYVKEHLDDNTMTLKDLCNKVLFINPDYFGRLFKKETGERFTQYVAIKRIEAAKKLIASGKVTNVAKIAEMTGFGDGAQYFSQVFRRHTGYTPSEYRDQKIYLNEE